jgi:hypothetical protein
LSTVLAVFQGADSPIDRIFQIFFNFPISLEQLIRYNILLARNIRIYILDQATIAALFSLFERIIDLILESSYFVCAKVRKVRRLGGPIVMSIFFSLALFILCLYKL